MAEVKSLQVWPLTPSKASPGQMLNSHTTASRSFPWERLPFETREQIFEELDQDSPWRCSTYLCADDGLPAIIIALRGSPISHKHAFREFMNANPIVNFRGTTDHDLLAWAIDNARF